MHEVEVSRFLPESPVAVRRRLTPERLVEHAGTFSVTDVKATDDATIVIAGATGMQVQLRFSPIENGWQWQQVGEAGPFEEMETTLTVAAENEGSRVTARSSVSLGVPLPLTDRIAAWKRKGELKRLLDGIAESVE